MAATITKEQRAEIEAAGDMWPAEVVDLESRKNYVLVPRDLYDELMDRYEQDAWQALGRKAMAQWAKDEPWPQEDYHQGREKSSGQKSTESDSDLPSSSPEKP